MASLRVAAVLLVSLSAADAFLTLRGPTAVPSRTLASRCTFEMMAKKSGVGSADKLQVLLKGDVAEIGKANTVVMVNKGYFNNFLAPKALASIISDEAVAVRVAEAAEEARVIKQAAMDTAEALKLLKIALKRKVGGGNKIFGSVTNKQILDEIKLLSPGLAVSAKQKWDVPDVSGLGSITVNVQLHPEVSVAFNVDIVEQK
eukprot:CAMPEP_0180158280 /NCGR_PEP_ID=MMETSP0986-20121125/26804_1 /TAXON_ID=697907 /ORGANISM="non described non described, Strain CCMP2293" /LENGTH=201 /DNA_ID=CAMNT_0022108083 /DNA_START=6 /DNA_END=614 /DNA_ORIENTATION=-